MNSGAPEGYALILSLPAIGGLIVNANPWKNAIIPNACVSWSIPRISAISIVRKHTTVPVKRLDKLYPKSNESVYELSI